MGWWWNSDPKTSTTEPPARLSESQITSSQHPTSEPTVSQDPIPPIPSQHVTKQLQPQPTTLTPEHLTPSQREEAELQKLFAEINPQRHKDGQPTPAQQRALQDTIPYPDTMKCHTLFDSAYHCASAGGQLNNLYRYGELRQCSDHWNAFWFCMRTRTYSPEARKEAIREFYREQERKVRSGRNSGDVWDERSVEERRRMAGEWMERDPDEDVLV